MHSNDLEHIVTMIPLSLVNGLVMPYPTIGLLSIYFVGRMLYTKGYFEKEGAFNKKRMIGSMMCNVGHFGTIALSMGLGYRITRGKAKLSI